MENLESIVKRINTTTKALEEQPRQNLEMAIKELLEISKELDVVKKSISN